MTAGTTTGVFVLGEHEVVRRGLVDLVASAPDLRVVGSAGTVEEALPLIAGSSPQVVLLDARPWDGAGIAIGRQIRAEHPEVRCILLTSFDDDEALLTAVMIGAVAHLVRSIGGNSLLDGIRAVAAGRSLLDGAVTERLWDGLRRSGHDDRDRGLDGQERQVLELVSQGRTDRQIAEETHSSAAEVQRLVTGIHGKLSTRRRDRPNAVAPGILAVESS